MAKTHTYYVSGMHCASCEILLEREFKDKPGVKSVSASTTKGQVTVEYDGQRPAVKEINIRVVEYGYTVADQPILDTAVKPKANPWKVAVGVAVIIGLFILVNRTGVASAVSVSSNTALPAFFVFGLVAGLSSCAALVGGIVLSMSKQWAELHPANESVWRRFHPHLMFNVGRLVAFAVFGALLGSIGQAVNLSITVTSIFTVVVSLLMILLGLQMVGIRSFQRFQLRLPKFITRRAADHTRFNGRAMPFIMGGLTFFLPCGFTIVAQGLALVSGSPLVGFFIMTYFALGTMPMLVAIGLSSVTLTRKAKQSAMFMKVAGLLVLFFSLYNLNAQLNVFGLPSLTDISFQPTAAKDISTKQANDLPPIVGGKQILSMEASSRGYSPNRLKVRAGIPVRWEIKDVGTSGCTSGLIARQLFAGQIDFTPGTTSVKEFTPPAPGSYKFSCWMGMISGTIEVVKA